ncbi:helicase required for RNAi-mediated heterochromatin assembly 1, partial [Lecanoromycetidae sp. Uapishka_2]
MTSDDPPIIIAAHTNHALDQLLRHISRFEPDFIRLGGWTKDMEIIKPRTLYEVKEAVKHSIPPGSMRKPALAKLKQHSHDIANLLKPLTEGKEPLTATVLKKYGVISEAQYDSLVQGAQDWVRAGAEDDVTGDVAIWLGDERVEAKQRTLPEDFGIEVEEVDLEFEQLKEIEAESKMVDEEDRDTLRGPRVVFKEPWTGVKSIGVTEKTVYAEMQKRDLWEIPSEYRGPVYRHMQQKVKEAIRAKVRDIARSHAIASQEAKIGMWELDYNYLRQARVIGMTTTGLSKYRGLLSSLDPKVVLIEEAAETLEAPIAVACFKTLEHLILVGDHQQLRGHCNDEELANAPFYLGVSMFERLVRNQVEFSQLKRQRRMHPEIRRALKPIYQELEDHPSVLKRPMIPGMGEFNSYFFTHKWRETSDVQMSKINHEEADMVVAFFRYLVQNGMLPKEITVLTFYNGQRKLILRKLFEQRLIYGSEYFNVVTVDSYQGEENAVVLLSLIQHALVHKEKTFIGEPSEFASLDGGCSKPCREELPCGHLCVLNCHSFSHEAVNCQEPCSRTLDCGHQCIELCYLECKSDCDCEPMQEEIPEPISYAKAASASPEKEKQVSPTAPRKRQQPGKLPPRTTSPQKAKTTKIPAMSSAACYRNFAAGGHLESDRNFAAMAEQDSVEVRQKRLDEENFAALFGGPEQGTAVGKQDDMKLVRTKNDGRGGTREIWKGTMEVPQAKKVGSKKQESSLLD